MMTAMASPTPSILTSLANPRVKAATALRDRRERDRTGLTLLDGAREIRRAIDADTDIVEAFMCESLLAGPDARAALDGLRAAGVVLLPTSAPVFAKLAFGERSEGLVAVARIPSLDLGGLVVAADPLVAVVEGVEKPGNIGAILRSADGAGDRCRRGRLATHRSVQSECDPGECRDDLHRRTGVGPDRRRPRLAP